MRRSAGVRVDVWSVGCRHRVLVGSPGVCEESSRGGRLAYLRVGRRVLAVSRRRCACGTLRFRVVGGDFEFCGGGKFDLFRPLKADPFFLKRPLSGRFSARGRSEKVAAFSGACNCALIAVPRQLRDLAFLSCRRRRHIDDAGVVFEEVSGRGARNRTGEIPYCGENAPPNCSGVLQKEVQSY